MTYNKAQFEISLCHTIDDMERCTEPDGTCSEEHIVSLFLRNPDTEQAEWLSDHLTLQLAELSAIAYEPFFKDIVSNQHT